MRRSWALVTTAAVLAVAAVVAGVVHARQPPSTPAGSYTRATCLLGSPQLRDATTETLAGLDDGVFSRFRVLEPPPPPLTSDHYRGPLWVYVTLAGASDEVSHDLSAEWEADLAQGALAERCSAGLERTQQAVVGSSVRYAVGHDSVGGGSGVAPAGEVFPAQRDGESDDAIVADAQRVLARYGLTPESIRVLHPLGPALLVEASTDDAASVRGRVPEIEQALDGGDLRHPEFEGIYLALDGPAGPLSRSGADQRLPGGFGWTAPGFASGFQHG